MTKSRKSELASSSMLFQPNEVSGSLLKDLLISFVQPYLEPYEPCLWTDELPDAKEEKIKEENKVCEQIFFKLTEQGDLAYKLDYSVDKNSTGQYISSYIISYHDLLRQGISFEHPLTQAQLEGQWPKIWQELARRGHARYDLEVLNRWAANDEGVYQLYKEKLTEHLGWLIANGNVIIQRRGRNDLDQVDKMLGINYRLLFERCTVVAHNGSKLIDHRPYSIALGGPEPMTAHTIMTHYLHPNGNINEEMRNNLENERNEIEVLYGPAIENRLKQKAYDYHELFQIINTSYTADINAELDYNNHKDHESRLRHALEAFRCYFKPRAIIEGMMHSKPVEYLSAINEFKKNEDNFRDLSYLNLFALQVVGYLQLVGLSAYERQAFAQSSDTVVTVLIEAMKKMEISEYGRWNSFKLAKAYDNFYFPPFLHSDNSHTGVGFENCIDSNSLIGQKRIGDSSHLIGAEDKFPRLCDISTKILKSIIETQYIVDSKNQFTP